MARKRSGGGILKRNLDKLLSNRLALLGLALLLCLILLSAFAPVITSYDPNKITLPDRLIPPGMAHPLGTDKLGRDIFARLLYGGRVSMLVGICGALGSAFIGVVIGCVSGYFGKKLDQALLYTSEIVMIFPQFILVLILVSFMGRGLINLILVFSFTGWTSIHRLVRTQILSLKEENYIQACEIFGVSKLSIMFSHLLPNTLGPVIVSVTLSTAGYVLGEAGLSFLGLGVPPELATWGNIINAANGLDVLKNYPWLWVPAGIFISLFVLSVNFFGDGLRDALDPKQ